MATISKELEPFKSESKKELEELTIGEIGVEMPKALREKWANDKCSINSRNNGFLFNEAIWQGYYDYALAILATCDQKGKAGFDINSLDDDGRSPCKAVIWSYACRCCDEAGIGNNWRKLGPSDFEQERYRNKDKLLIILQRLIDAGAKITANFTKEEARLSKTYIRPETCETLLDFALWAKIPEAFKLNLNCGWTGYPTPPPPIFPPIKILLKSIYFQINRDAILKQRMKELLFPEPLNNLICSYVSDTKNLDFITLPATTDPKFDSANKDRTKLLYFGRLFFEYDEAMNQKAKKAQLENLLETQEINAPTKADTFLARLSSIKDAQTALRQDLAEQRKFMEEALAQQQMAIAQLTTAFEFLKVQKGNRSSTTNSKVTNCSFN